MARVALYLASTSPRRAQLLRAAGVPFALCRPGPEYASGDEFAAEPGAPDALAAARARRKAFGALAPAGDAPVLGVDTVVDLDGAELGKARDREAAAAMLHALAGRRHRVHTAHCLYVPATGRFVERLAAAEVECRVPTGAAFERYLDSGQWQGKAGGYGIQDPAQDFLSLAAGSLDTVIGLSVAAVLALLDELRGAP